MSIFENPNYPTFIIVGNEKPSEQKKYGGVRIFPYNEINITNPPVKLDSVARVGDLYFASVPNANVVIKTDNIKNIGFSTHVPCIGDTIPVKSIYSNKGIPEYKDAIVKISKMIKLSVNCYVINPNGANEWVLLSSEA